MNIRSKGGVSAAFAIGGILKIADSCGKLNVTGMEKDRAKTNLFDKTLFYEEDMELIVVGDSAVWELMYFGKAGADKQK